MPSIYSAKRKAIWVSAKYWQDRTYKKFRIEIRKRGKKQTECKLNTYLPHGIFTNNQYFLKNILYINCAKSANRKIRTGLISYKIYIISYRITSWNLEKYMFYWLLPISILILFIFILILFSPYRKENLNASRCFTIVY